MSGKPGLAPWAEKHLANPPLRLLFRLGIAPRAFALMETTGRRTGRRRLTPVGNGLDGDVFWLIAARGRRSSYAANLTAHPRCRVKVGRRWHDGTARFLDEDDTLARRARLDQANGLPGHRHQPGHHPHRHRPVRAWVAAVPAQPARRETGKAGWRHVHPQTSYSHKDICKGFS